MVGGSALTRPKTMYGMISPGAHEFYSYGGAVLEHDNKAELEWLFRDAIVAEIPAGETNRFPLALHPDMQAVRFPLRREDFR